MQQVAFADKILLNKLDLVSEADKKNVIKRIRVSEGPQAAWFSKFADRSTAENAPNLYSLVGCMMP